MTDIACSALATALIVSLAARANLMNGDTAAPVRWAFAAQAGAALLVALAPWVRPAWVPAAWMALLASVVLVQLVTARYWSRGAPQQFLRLPDSAPNDPSRPAEFDPAARHHREAA
jgi:hypothetical protein